MSDISSGSIDINLHTGDDGSGRGPDGDMKVVIETLRTGYQWKSRVLRPAMVKVKG